MNPINYEPGRDVSYTASDTAVPALKPLAIEVNIDAFLAHFEGHPNGERRPKYANDPEYFANPEFGDNWTPLMVSARWGYVETVKELLKRKADPTTYLAYSSGGEEKIISPLSLAKQNGHTEIEKLLKEAGAKE